MSIDKKVYETKIVKTKKETRCVESGRYIPKGKEVESGIVYPGSRTGKMMGLEKPFRYHLCGDCLECTHGGFDDN